MHLWPASSRSRVQIQTSIENSSSERARTRILHVKKTYLIPLKSESVDCLYCYGHQYPREQLSENIDGDFDKVLNFSMTPWILTKIDKNRQNFKT